MVELGVSSDHVIDGSDSPVPEEWRNHSTSHIESFVYRPSIDHNDAAVGPFNHGAVTLTYIQERHVKLISIEHNSGRPDPPEQQQHDSRTGHNSEQDMSPFRPDHPKKGIKHQHRDNGGRSNVPFPSRHPG